MLLMHCDFVSVRVCVLVCALLCFLWFFVCARTVGHEGSPFESFVWDGEAARLGVQAWNHLD